MQLSLYITLLALAVFLPFASAAVLEEKREEDGVPCKPLLQSCAVDSECCGDLCVLGVRHFLHTASLFICLCLFILSTINLGLDTFGSPHFQCLVLQLCL